jgi:hypothetical protein
MAGGFQQRDKSVWNLLLSEPGDISLHTVKT